MQKIYVLLRHDKQTGPYSLEEIIQFDLKPYDLIWIEGKSAGWWYPQEIAALHPYLSFLPQKPKPASPPPTTEKKAVVQTPLTNEAPPTSPFQEPLSTASVEKEYFPTTASKNLEEAVYAQFREPVSAKEPAVIAASVPPKKRSPNPVFVGVTSVLIIGGVFATSWILNRQPIESSVTESTTEAPAPEEITPPAVAANDNTKQEKTVSTIRKKERQKTSFTAPVTTAEKPVNRQSKNERKKVGDATEEATPYEMTGNTRPDADATPTETTSAPTGTNKTPEEKKKSIKDKFLDLFRKKPQEGAGEKRSTETENGERVATRRETDLLQSVHVRFDVPNDWMMGINGAKATMVNRSSETIKSATVEVLYYNDENELLQKKIVTFGKIEGKDSQTIAIPNHPTATKVDYRVITVTGAGQPAA